MIVIGQYRYFYGAGGSLPNRSITFLRDGENPETIRGEVTAYSKNTKDYTDRISTVDGKNISVEMKSTSQKMEELIKSRSDTKFKLEYPEKNLSDLSGKEQNNLIESFEPNGNWRVEITNDIDRNSRYEKVVHLCLFNPS